MKARTLFDVPVPLVVSYGMGVDSTAMLVGLAARGVRPDLILFADTGGEKPETYAYRAVIDRFLAGKGFPTVTTVRYVPSDFKNWPPYATLEENCLTNGTLPSLAFGFKSCSLKWKVAPQEKYLRSWPPAIACWALGGKLRRAIGYDAGPADLRRRNHVSGIDDPRNDYCYPLIEWGWNRERCAREIASAGLAVPPKSSCFFCPAMRRSEVDALAPGLLRRIVVLEARAKPRLRDIQGLWRNGTKGTRGGEAKPGSMTAYIRSRGLLPADEIERLIASAPREIVSQQERHAYGRTILSWSEFFDALSHAAA